MRILILLAILGFGMGCVEQGRRAVFVPSVLFFESVTSDIEFLEKMGCKKADKWATIVWECAEGKWCGPGSNRKLRYFCGDIWGCHLGRCTKGQVLPAKECKDWKETP
jgi:hypothetical protein